MKYKIKEISPNLFEVLGHSVKIQIKKGRKIILCDCLNHTKFCVENPFCLHKELVIKHILFKPFKKRLDKLIEVYENWVENKLPINPELCLNDLKELKCL